MPIPTLNKLPPEPNFNDLVRKINSLVGEITNLLLNLDDVNFDKITANVINVNELSAISANLGTITAGIIRGIEIYGSYIATAEGTYPRAEMSNTLNLFRAYASALRHVSVVSFDSGGSPGVVWSDNGQVSSAQMASGKLSVSSGNNLEIGALSDVNITAGGDIHLGPFGDVILLSWAILVNSFTGRTLQQDLDSKATSGASTGSGGSAFRDGGIPIGTQLAISGGGSVTWAGISIPGHSHTQS